MPTKLSRYAEGVMEAAWLAAVMLVPVFFNVYSSRIFEPDKITLLRSLALVILAAWVVKLIEQGGSAGSDSHAQGRGLKAILRIPLVAVVSGAGGFLPDLNHLLGHSLHQPMGLLPALARHLHYFFLSGDFLLVIANLRRASRSSGWSGR